MTKVDKYTQTQNLSNGVDDELQQTKVKIVIYLHNHSTY